jgi:hypothetical protein
MYESLKRRGHGGMRMRMLAVTLHRRPVGEAVEQLSHPRTKPRKLRMAGEVKQGCQFGLTERQPFDDVDPRRAWAHPWPRAASYTSGRRARAVEFSTAIRIAIAENNKASGHRRALHVKRRTRVAQTPIYRYDGERAPMRHTQLALPREPVRRRGAQTVEWPRVIVDGKASNDQHALCRRASPLQRGRSSG